MDFVSGIHLFSLSFFNRKGGSSFRKVQLIKLKHRSLSFFHGNSASIIWIATGSQFFGGYLKMLGESFERGFSDEWQTFLQQIKVSGRKVAFLSGDIHATELMKIEESILDYETLEFTSSGLIRENFDMAPLALFPESLSNGQGS